MLLPKPNWLNLTKRIRLAISKPSNANAFTTYAVRTLDCGLLGGQKLSVEVQVLHGSVCLQNMLPAPSCGLKNGG